MTTDTTTTRASAATARIRPTPKLSRAAVRANTNGSVAQFGKRRPAQNGEVVGSSPTRTTDRSPNWLTLALMFANQFKGF
jgi:hypothetical protein